MTVLGGEVAIPSFEGYAVLLRHQARAAGFGRGRSLVVQVVLLAVSGFVMATSYFLVNVFIKGYPVAVISYVRDLFGQALVSIILALILTKGAERALKGLKI